VELKIGDKVRIYDSCFQHDVIEPIVRIVNSQGYGELIYTKAENPLGYDERVIRRENIKELIRQKKNKENAVEHPATAQGCNR